MNDRHSEVSYVVMVSVDGQDSVHGTLTITRKYERVRSSSPRPDPRWFFIDSSGHYHAYDIRHEREHRSPYLTLDERKRFYPCNGIEHSPDECDGWSDTYYTCIVCGEEIKPGTIEGPHSINVYEGEDWELEVETPIPSSGRVSVHITSAAKEWFGFAVVSWLLTSSTGGRSILTGVTPLGVRQTR